jgi:DNA repair protein RecO (recombination protein O)
VNRVTEKAVGIVVRGTDYSETSRIATIWTREFGKVRVLAKGGRRPRSNFESALDLLTHCSIVFIRKTGGGLDLLTEARVLQRFAGLRRDLAALNAGYYAAELLGDLTEDADPHPALFDETVDLLGALGAPGVATGPRLLRFETVLLKELGYEPQLGACAGCRGALPHEATVQFSPAAGGLICGQCRTPPGAKFRIAWETAEAWRRLLADPRTPLAEGRATRELRQILGQYVSHLLGRRPRTLNFLPK